MRSYSSVTEHTQAIHDEQNLSETIQHNNK